MIKTRALTFFNMHGGVATARHPPCPVNPPLFIQADRGTVLLYLATTTTITTRHHLHPLVLTYSHCNRHAQASRGTSLPDDTLELGNGRGNYQKYMH